MGKRHTIVTFTVFMCSILLVPSVILVLVQVKFAQQIVEPREGLIEFTTIQEEQQLRQANDHDLLEGRDLICYGSQGPAKSYAPLKLRFENSFPAGSYALFYHSFDENCDGCIFQNGTKFCEGKNLATKTAMTSPLWHRCKYFTFFDDDIELLSNPRIKQATVNETWKEYHEMLLLPETKHPIIKPKLHDRDLPSGEELMTMYQSCVDENFLSFRFDYLALFFPMTTKHKENFWFNNDLFFLKMERCYPGGILVDHRFIVQNPKHRYNWGTEAYQISLTAYEEVLEDELPGLGPWKYLDRGRQGHRCRVNVVPSLGWHPTCAAAMNRRLDLWLKDELIP